MKYTVVIVTLDFYSAHKSEVAWNQLIHRRLTRTNRWAVGQDSDSQAFRHQTGDSYGEWCLEFRGGGRYGEEDESG